ncbi:MAG: zinc-binding alcohol dehydrogenase family protein [Planctomycetota bacterium]|jgi:2-desacetyl-2-hydroxyethyl bacteriochlorophyllide A dehydrogenase
MRAIQIAAPKQLKRIDIPEPDAPGPGMALVRTHRMGVCGTDVSCYLGKFPFFDFPRIPGHELGVEVLALGPGVHHLSVGDRCSVEPYMNCGDCYACRKGAGNCCTQLKVIGVMMDGGLCDRFVVRADKLHPSKLLSMDQLALVETLAIGCHACQRSEAGPNHRVLLIGAGPIGIATLEFVRLSGAEVTVMDMNPSRLDFVEKTYGIHRRIAVSGSDSGLEAAKHYTDRDLYDIVIDATGNPHSMSSALQFVAPTGTLVYVGITQDQIAFKHPALHRPEISLLASRNALPKDFPYIIGLIESGIIQTEPWITHRTSFEDAVRDFDALTRPESGVLKAVIELV